MPMTCQASCHDQPRHHIGCLPRNRATRETCAMVGRLRAYMAVVSAIGLVVLALLAASVDLGRVRDSLPEGAMLALVVLVAPFLSIPLSRDGRGPSVHVDTPFVFALALAAGTGAAAVVMAASGVLYDLAHRKPFHKIAFNIAFNNGTHTIGLAA